MDFFQTSSNNNRIHHNKKRLTQDQVKLLERSFSSNNKLEPERKLLLAKQLGIPARQVSVWYQNKRARWKTQSLEVGYNALQMKLDTALAEKRRLEKDVERLKGELNRAHELCMALSNQRQVSSGDNHPVVCSVFSSSCDQEGAASSSLLGDHVVNREIREYEDLYACLIGMQ